jgi:flagellin
MSLNSVNTNMGAMVALQSLESTSSQLTATQKQISTGYRVADASDDGAAFAIAQGIRSTVGGLTSANQQLGNVTGLLNTTQSALTDVSNQMITMRNVLVKLADSNVTGNDRTNYQTQYSALLQNVRTDITDATYNNKTLIGNIPDASGATAGFTSAGVNVSRDGSGNSYPIGQQGQNAMFQALSALGAAGLSASDYQKTLASTAANTFNLQQNNVNASLNTIGSNINYVNNQTTFNNNKIDALNSGLGSLVDADLAKESAQLTALQIRQQLGTQALSMANQAPQTLLSLFK